MLARSLSSTNCDVFLAIGTSALVQPAASLTVEAKRRGALAVEINPENTPHTELVDVSVKGSAVQVLSSLENLRHSL